MLEAAALPADAGAAPHGVIGPNSVIQLAHALEAGPGAAGSRRVFAAAGQPGLLDDLPAEMIDERIPARLFAALWDVLPADVAFAVARDAGFRTARYIIASRIPAAARFTLRCLPRRFAGRALLAAIERSAWTFAGSGRCTTRAGEPALIEIAANPLLMPDCIWHQAVFGELFRFLVTPDVRVRYSRPDRHGAGRCRFELFLEPA